MPASTKWSTGEGSRPIKRALLPSSIFSVYNITFIEGRHTFVEEIRYGF